MPHRRALTALVGQAIKEVGNNEYLNVDIVHRTLGGRSGLRDRAVDIEVEGRMVKIMHPIDVIGSRLINLHKLPERQNELGDAQMSIAIEIGQRITKSERDEKVLLETIEVFATMARSDAGRKVADRRALHVADAIDPANALHVQAFRQKRLPQIMLFMSEKRRAAVAASFGTSASS